MSTMFTNIKKAVSNLEVDKIIFLNIKKQESKLIKINTQEQLFEKGVNSNLEKIKPLYSNPYKAIRRAENLSTDKVQLYRSGDFYKSIGIRQAEKGVVYQSKSKIAKYLIRRYGREILGVNIASYGFVQKMVIQDIRKKLNLR